MADSRLGSTEEGRYTPKGAYGIPPSSVAESLRRTIKRVMINFVEERELTTVPGIGQKFAAKIVKVRALVGNITPEVLISCVGGRADRHMIDRFDFAPNEDRMDPDKDEEEPLGAVKDPFMLAALTKMMSEIQKKELVTPKGPRQGTEPRRIWGEEDDNEDQGVVRRGARRGPRGLPKNLSFDGKSNWAAFKQKFERYAEAYEWTEEECLNCLCWSLVGKAAEFYATVTERMENLSFRVLLKKLEKRFGASSVPASYAERGREFRGLGR